MIHVANMKQNHVLERFSIRPSLFSNSSNSSTSSKYGSKSFLVHCTSHCDEVGRDGEDHDEGLEA
jgi:hypothetical protein